jgi:mono/diheme cytochrome c family protein
MTAVVLLAEVGEEEHEAVEQPGPGAPGEPEPGEPTETTPTAPEPQPEPEPGETETPPPPPAGSEGDPAAGKEVFTTNCGSCHTLADAGTTGSVGPNLDESQPTVELAVDRVTNGQGVMPPFADTLSEQQIQDVAAYVSTATGG